MKPGAIVRSALFALALTLLLWQRAPQAYACSPTEPPPTVTPAPLTHTPTPTPLPTATWTQADRVSFYGRDAETVIIGRVISAFGSLMTVDIEEYVGALIPQRQIIIIPRSRSGPTGTDCEPGWVDRTIFVREGDTIVAALKTTWVSEERWTAVISSLSSVLKVVEGGLVDANTGRTFSSLEEFRQDRRMKPQPALPVTAPPTATPVGSEGTAAPVSSDGTARRSSMLLYAAVVLLMIAMGVIWLALKRRPSARR